MPPITTQIASALAEQSTSSAGPVRVLRQFRVVFNAVKTHFRQVERDAGIGGAQLWALSVIQTAPDIGMNELSKALDIHQSTASNLIKGLIERGLVATVRSSTDRRAVSLRILPAGSAILDKAPMPFSGVLPNALASLDAETLTRLELDLAKLIQILAVDETAANIPLSEQ
ncbi:MAG: winged helix-turn-helix transcriptional regulator [Rhodoferax sp.]|nr:winged helix-turn-helix transcriptional regulator [Rhodoferax sp.]